ncbi:hypothetical protein EMCRGX_G024119 [Ephydatia muelleri]|eukprot:Em0015g349a
MSSDGGGLPASVVKGNAKVNKRLEILRGERARSISDVSNPPDTDILSMSSASSELRPQFASLLKRGTSAEPSGETLARTLPASILSPRVLRTGRRGHMSRAPTIDTGSISWEDLEDYTMVNQYKVLDIIGSGSYGVVRKAVNDDKVYAMKIVGKRKLQKMNSFRGKATPQKNPLEKIKKEIAILKKLDHENVVKLHEVLDDPHEDDIIMVFEHVPNGPIIDPITPEKRISEDKARKYFIDILLGLEYLHSQHIIHRDIKPQNLLLDIKDRVKIADFGVSEEVETSNSDLSRSAGTPAFTAPECLNATNSSYKGWAVDIWAAGVTLYALLFGRVPFTAKSVVDLYEVIQTQPVEYPSDVTISPEARSLLERLLEKDPGKRIPISEIRRHAWILQSPTPLPSKEENCQTEIAVTDEDMKEAIKPFVIPIHILVMIKQMAKKKTLLRPFFSRQSSSPVSSPTLSRKSSPKTLSLDPESDPIPVSSVPVKHTRPCLARIPTIQVNEEPLPDCSDDTSH